MPPVLPQMLETIRRHRMVAPGERVGVGVSGGADSVALLLLLEDAREELGIRLAAVHFNHQLRGARADADERFVAELAARRGVEFLAGREDVAARAREHAWNLEDAARRLRYQFFATLVAAGRVDRVAVAHTADDQAETLLARLLRGTGPLGLAGIYPVVGEVVRPLLGIRRRELRDFLSARGQEWHEDETNLDTARLRARIRQRLLPLLEGEFQAAAVDHLGRLASLAREDEAFWSALVEERFRALVTPAAEGLRIRIPDLLAPLPFDFARAEMLPGEWTPQRALAKRLVRHILAGTAGELRGVDAVHIEQVLHLAAESTSGHRVELPGGVVVERSFDALVFALRAGTARTRGETSPSAASYEYAVELPARGDATVSVPEIGRRFRLKVIDWPSAPSETKNTAAALDRDLLRPPLVLRNWRPGDAYRPRGRRQVRKLKRLFLDRRIAARERAGWPVLTSAGRPVWARGLPPAEEVAAGAGTNTGLLIAEEAL